MTVSRPAGVAARNPIADEFKQQVLKHLPVMRLYKLDEAAAYLEAWVQDKMELEPLLDVAASAGFVQEIVFQGTQECHGTKILS